MFRYLVAHLPCFRLERCGWDARQPVALLIEQRGALRLQCVTPAAHRLGVRVGMTRAAAAAIAPQLQTEVLAERNLAAEQRDLEDLAAQLLRVSPNVAALPPDGLVAELEGGEAKDIKDEPSHMRERATLERIRIRLEQLGHQVQVVVADDPATALAVATWGRGCQVIRPGEGAQALSPLPLAALGLREADHTLLLGLGIQTIGQFAALPAAAVVGRLSPVGVAAHALAIGSHNTTPVAPWSTEEPLLLSQDLPDPVTEHEALLFVLNALVREACARLAGAGRAISAVCVHLELDSGEVQDIRVRFGDLTRNPGHILNLLRLRLEQLRLAGPVTGLALSLPQPSNFRGRQQDLLDLGRTREAVGQVVTRLQDALGSQAVAVPTPVDTHRPESAFRANSADISVTDSKPPVNPSGPASPTPSKRTARITQHTLFGPKKSSTQGRTDPVDEWEGHPAPLPPIRPTILLDPPQAIHVQVPPGGLPLAIDIDGRWVEVCKARGPERLEGEWWDRGFHRTYWLVTLKDGRRAWLYQEDGQWALHGWFD